MKHIAINIAITVVILGCMALIPLPNSRLYEAGADRTVRDAAYGIPLVFREENSGGLIGDVPDNFNVVAFAVDGLSVSLICGALQVTIRKLKR